MKKYIKKPVEVEAIQLTEDNIIEIFNFLDDTNYKEFKSELELQEMEDYIQIQGHLVIRTLEGDMKANFGDYIIKGIKGEFYPCKPGIFEATYEEVKSRGQNERAKLRSLEEILSKIEEYENNIQFLDEEEIKEELKQELVILKWCVGLVERI